MRSEIRVERAHTMGTGEITTRVVTLGSGMASKYGLVFPDDEVQPEDGYEAALAFQSVSGLTKGMKGTLHVAQAKILMVLELPFALRPMADTIEQEIKAYLDANSFGV